MQTPAGDIFSFCTSGQFEEIALKLFRWQAQNNPVYAGYIRLREINPSSIRRVEDIPFLPVEFFRTQRVISGREKPRMEFTSSGTTGTVPSRHLVINPELYRESFSRCFEIFYGSPSSLRILALLPSYLERKGSSLVHMAKGLISMSGHPESNFCLDNLEVLSRLLAKHSEKTLLLGVSFALLELAEKYPAPLKNTIVMETGGMKGRREEITRQELHSILKEAFQLESIHSEYGMTEILSQAYTSHEGVFQTPPWMRIYIRDRYDPLSMAEPGQTGGINIIDLANAHSCAFIETEDLGRLHPSGGFEVLGRFDQSTIRGCNLMFSGE